VKQKMIDNFRTKKDILMKFFVVDHHNMVWNDDEMVGVAASLSQPRPPNQG
jgi:hypothetical protein